MNYLKTFDSVVEASNNVGGASIHITECCRGVVKTAYGFIWRYVNDLEQSIG